MALFHVQFFSEVLGVSSAMDVILPQPAMGQIGMDSTQAQGKLPTLYLLHGLSDDHTIWQRRTSIERYVANLPLAVVMPAVGRSFYTDMKHGGKYWRFVSEELPRICETFFPLSNKREDRFAAGLSMGGYGALKLGLRCPEKYAAVASLSGCADLVTFVEGRGEDLWPDGEFGNMFGSIDQLRGSKDDLSAVATRLLASGGEAPSIYMCCGTEDFLLESNRHFVKNHGEALHIQYEEFPGAHTWEFWDEHIQHVLKWLPIQKA